MSKDAIISHNSDFLFLYEAIQCNPNGDIDQENKPRMDYDTQTNLVTDVRVKRYIRDFLKTQNHDIFVDMEGENKVSPDSKLKAVLQRLLAEPGEAKSVFEGRDDLAAKFDEIQKKSPEKSPEGLIKFLQDKKNKELCSEVNRGLLAYLVRQKFIDIRFFGSAFAIEGFTKSYVGPIQLNWGYSLHKVQLMESNSIVTIMNDGSSTIGKDYRVHYSLLAFSGAINKYAAVGTGLTDSDLTIFRKAIWESIPALPTRSKLNQYPKLYVEVVYNNGFHNGHFGDLRQHISVKPKAGLDEKQIRKFDDLDLELSALRNVLKDQIGADKPVKQVIVNSANGVQFSL
ncbi:MAG: type I-B CRISPR-associated protein Cas7/Csh2 [Bacteroidetes bacterium]|nr:type I-B CRISPR-associated protein Cas7/Csh2 [Bacteroidota bacterium]